MKFLTFAPTAFLATVVSARALIPTSPDDVSANTWGKVKWSDCGSRRDALRIHNLDISPNPLKNGGQYQVTINGTLKHVLTYGDRIELAIFHGDSVVSTRNWNICSEFNERCPMPPGDFRVTTEETLAPGAPPVYLHYEYRAFNHEDVQFGCVNAELDLRGKPGSLLPANSEEITQFLSDASPPEQIPFTDVVSAHAAGNIEWTDCGFSEDVLKLDSVEIDPNPVKPGQSYNVTFKGTMREDMEYGAFMSMTIKLGLIKLMSKTIDLCEDETYKIDCPLKKGDFTIVKSLDLPREVPPGKFSIDLDGYTNADQPLICIRAKADFLPRPSEAPPPALAHPAFSESIYQKTVKTWHQEV